MKNKQIEEQNKKFMFDPNEKISIFLGAYGSGKSEVAVNFSLLLSNRLDEAINNYKTGMTNGRTIVSNEADSKTSIPESSLYNQIVLADLDMINPYFRSVDAKNVLNNHNIKVISPQFANTNVEVPAVPVEIFSVFDQEGIRAVLDIGGEDLGARVVSSLKSRILSVSFATYMVVNMNRPFTNSKDKISIMMRELEEATGLRTDGIINNTNMLSFSCAGDLLEANRVLMEVQKETGVPLCFASGMEGDYPVEWGNIMPDGVPFLRLSRTISYEETIVL